MYYTMKNKILSMSLATCVLVLNFYNNANIKASNDYKTISSRQNSMLDSTYKFVTPSGIKSEELEQKIDNYMNKFINKHISGAQISITKDNKIVFSKGYGLSNREDNLEVNTSTTFNYASISKLFIWVSAMQLVEQNKLDLNKDIREYLPENYPMNIKSKKPVTFLNLMNHNAGFESYWKYHDGTGESCDFNSLEEAVHSCYSGIQCFEPGEFVGYSNYGANLAAYIIERISKTPFYEYVEKNIFKVCNMNVCYPEKKCIEKILKNKALGYITVKLKDSSLKKFVKTNCYSGDWLYPSGSVIGSADELSKFAMALMPKSGKKSVLFKKSSTLDKMLKISYTPSGGELFSIHHGFWGTDGNTRGIGHTGCVDGMVSNFVIVPEENFSVSVLINDQYAANIISGLISMLTGHDYEEIKNKSQFSDSKIFEGQYVHARTKIFDKKSPFVTYEIKKSDKNNNILVTIGENSDPEEYVQIRPYVYENIKSISDSDVSFSNKIYFKVKDNKVIKAVVSKNDLIPIDNLIKLGFCKKKYVPN